MKIDAKVKQIESLKDYFFIVPDYQREYVWDSTKNVLVFLQDIYSEFNPTTANQTNYFIGSAIIVRRVDGQYDVIDGQQRLTTIIISLCSMRDILSTSNLEAVDGEPLLEIKSELLTIIKDLLYKFSIQQNRKVPRLTLQYEESKDYLSNLIGEKPDTPAETNSIVRMKEAYKAISTFLTEIYTDDKSMLINFIRYFLINVEIVIIEPDNIGSALKIFETINQRGVGLNPMDLLKNLLFINARENEFNTVKDIWRDIITTLESCGEGDKPLRFLRYFLIAKYHNGVIREEDIYQWVTSEEGKLTIKYDQNPVDFAKILLFSAKKYSSFVNATGWEADKDYPSLTGISYLSRSARQPLILLIALKDSFDKAAINLLARNIESLMFYYAINKIQTKYYEDLFAELAITIRHLNSLEDLKQFILAEFSNIIEKQQTIFEMGFDQKSQGDLQPLYRIKYILGKIEEYIRSKVFLPANSLSFYQEQQLEHILPQEGVNIPPYQYPNPIDYEISVKKLGNLTLLEGPINQSLNFKNDLSTNGWFEFKQKAYSNSNIVLTKTIQANTIGIDTEYNRFVSTQLRHFESWGPENIKQRQDMLKKLCLHAWGVSTS